jgi:hypothetical protein
MGFLMGAFFMRQDSLKRLLLGHKTPTKNGTPMACGKRSLQASRPKF